jgi:putative membrane protein
MKNLIRSGLAGVLALAGVALAQQGAQPGGSGSSAGSGSTMSGSPSAERKMDMKLEGRLEKLHADNQAEIQLGQIAAQNAQSPDVKQFAEQMQSDHKRLDGNLTQLAEAAGAKTLEGKDFQKAQKDAAKDAAKLQLKTGKDFDKAYMSKAVKEHEKDVKEVKKAADAAQKANQPELAALLLRAQTGMQGHLDHAKAVQKSLEKGGTQGTGSSSMGGTGSSGAAGQPSPSKPSGTGTQQ